MHERRDPGSNGLQERSRAHDGDGRARLRRARGARRAGGRRRQRRRRAARRRYGRARGRSPRREPHARHRRHPPARHPLRRDRRGDASTSRTRSRTTTSCARIAARAATTPKGEWIMTTPVGEPHYFLRRGWRDLARGPPAGPARARPRRARPSGVDPSLGARHPERHRVQLGRAREARHHARDARPGRARLDREGRGRRADRDPARLGHELLHRRRLHGPAAAPAAADAARQADLGDGAGAGDVRAHGRHDRLRRPRDGPAADRGLPLPPPVGPAHDAGAGGARRRSTTRSRRASRSPSTSSKPGSRTR